MSREMVLEDGYGKFYYQIDMEKDTNYKQGAFISSCGKCYFVPSGLYMGGIVYHHDEFAEIFLTENDLMNDCEEKEMTPKDYMVLELGWIAISKLTGDTQLLFKAEKMTQKQNDVLAIIKKECDLSGGKLTTYGGMTQIAYESVVSND